jgi:2'-5' RNA ligase
VSALRLFFALWPTAPERGALEAALGETWEALGAARRMPPESWHVTIAFLGSVEEAALGSLESVARRVAAECAHCNPIEVRLDQLDYWRKPQLLCAAPAAGSPTGTIVADALRRELVAAGFAPDLKPFRAHVTLARKVARAPPVRALSAVRWTFPALALVSSRTSPHGSLYSVVSSWQLDNS